MTLKRLTEEDKKIFEWQIWLEKLGESGQEKLKNTTALVSRCGGLGGPVAQSLACAGFGNIIVAHGGNLKHSDLNRQILMSYDGLGTPRADLIKKRLNEYNPHIEVTTVSENINEANVAKLVKQADIVFDCAPLFQERFLMNKECINQNKPMIEAAMYGLEGQVMTILPKKSACLACLYPEFPSEWKRQFPVIGAVSALAAQVAVLEGIKLITGIGKTLNSELFTYDATDWNIRKLKVPRQKNCKICGDCE